MLWRNIYIAKYFQKKKKYTSKKKKDGPVHQGLRIYFTLMLVMKLRFFFSRNYFT